eukprot:CAMPEP_0206427994 /NCGR_PEP_ID=MMETSP0324_2-20121206/5383_1 /ASSEMBLY_ACC=CAM_ASM_000836 /TAXON_ID=2866 /ORGANISM="Crypthecodinium cohnii, Strain Seligo" /LENGTH=242 /DNA_ID=CAMNT_0053893403 /DNA_START=490 /DNA_END=1219 /DNA_ORIENTATION=-
MSDLCKVWVVLEDLVYLQPQWPSGAGVFARTSEAPPCKSPEVLLDRFLEGLRKDVVVRRIVDTSNGLGAYEVVQLAREIVELLASLHFFFSLGLRQLHAMILLQPLLRDLTTLFNPFQVALATVEMMKMSTASPSSEILLHDRSTMMEELLVETPCAVVSASSRLNPRQPTSDDALNQQRTVLSRMPGVPDASGSVEALNGDHGCVLPHQVVAGLLHPLEVLLHDLVHLAFQSEKMGHGLQD